MVDSLKISHYDEGEFDVAAAAVVAVDDDEDFGEDDDDDYDYDDYCCDQNRTVTLQYMNYVLISFWNTFETMKN